MGIEPWTDMVATPMGNEFFAACERVDPEAEAQHRAVFVDVATDIIGDAASAEVLALDGLFADEPTVAVLEARARLLIDRFTTSSSSSSNEGMKEPS